MDLIIDRIQECRPRRIAVIGGGFVGLETAENLSHLDFEVSLIQRSAQVLSQLDPEMATFAHDTLRSNGIDLLLNSPIQSLQRNGSALSITFKDGRKLDTDMVIAALGVRPLNALAVSAALELDANGAVITDAHMRSSDPHIYAVGDVVSTEEIVTRSRRTVALAGPANRQARVAADNICGVTSTYNGAQASAILKLFDKTVSFTGISEKVAQANGLNYDKIYLFSPSHASYYPGSEDMIAKVLFDKESGRILGAQIFGGKGVDKRCDTLAIAIRSGLTPDDLKDMELCYAPPYASAKEPVNVIGNMIGNLLAGCVNQHHWHDIADLPRDGSVTLLDVRTATEYAEGAIPGYLNIPVDDLRERLSELDRSKPVYLYCHSGLRSYVAARILTQQGFTCSHLGGGYRLYQHIAAASLV
jgi:rhodanese-related sulfurtransferase